MITETTPTSCSVATEARLRATVEALCADECLPRLPGAAGGLRARALVEEAFVGLGLEPAGSDGYVHAIPLLGGANLVGRLPGPPRERTILITAHYDACAIDGGINPGADDNASGVAVIIEVARALAAAGPELGRNVVFVAFDAEEPPYFHTPQMGSMAFVADPPFPLDTIDANINLDNVGHRVGEATAPEIADTILIQGAETADALGRALDAAPDVAGLVPRRLDSAMFPGMSDHAAFENVGIPFLFYSAGRHQHYHATTDTPDVLAYDKMAALVEHLIEVIANFAADPEPRFGFHSGGSDPAATIDTLRALTTLLPSTSRIGAAARPTLDTLAARAAAGTFTAADRALARRLYLAFDDSLMEPAHGPRVVEENPRHTMTDYTAPDSLGRIGRAVRNGGKIIVITGAGISAESGVPTYRGDDGIWTEGGTTAMNKATLGYFMEHPDRSWQWNLVRRTEMMQAQPNAAHLALAPLEAKLGTRFGIITQNIDRLHIAAGAPPEHIIEIHGHIQGMRCSAGCVGVLPIPDHFDGWSAESVIGDIEMGLLQCPQCGYATRPHVLWFDEFYDEVHYRARTADSWVARASLCITIGTSGGVPFAVRMASIAAKAGALLVDINPHEGDLRRLAQESAGVVIAAPATVGVPAVVNAIEEVLA